MVCIFIVPSPYKHFLIAVGILCTIPTLGSEGVKMVVTRATTFQDIIRAISHSSHGSNIGQELSLAWKLSSDRKKGPGVCLNGEAEWTHALDRAYKKVSCQQRGADVEIIISFTNSQVLLFLL